MKISRSGILKKLVGMTGKLLPGKSIIKNENLFDDKLHSRKYFIKSAIGIAAAAGTGLVGLACGDAFNNDGGNHSGETGISFEITFNEAMDTASVENAISTAPSLDMSQADFQWSDNDTVLYCFRNTDKGTSYTVTVEGTARDKAGNYLDGNNDGTGGDAYSFDLQTQTGKQQSYLNSNIF